MVTTKSIKNLGIYCRVSSKKQMDGTSLNNQKERGIKWCNSNGYNFEIYSDVISGSKVNRDGLNELYERIYSGDLDGILLYEWDRLSRENRELMIQFEKLVEDTDCLVVVDDRVRDIR
jgi:putative resolvase